MKAWKAVSLIFWLALAVALPALATDSQLEPLDGSQTLITSAANARLRSAPGTQSSVVTNLPLGTELQLTDATGQGEWIRVRTSRGEEGWIRKTMALPISDSTYPKVVRELIAARLSRQDDGFVGRMELVAFIEHARGWPWSVEDLGWLELQRLRALQAALRTIPFRRERWDDRLRSWIAARAAEIRYSEPGGQWIINRDIILDSQATYRATAVADELAWFAAENGLTGECEGYLVCYLESIDKLQGEYLRRQPEGKHVEEAAARIKFIIEYYRGDFKPSAYFNATQDCAPLKNVVASLEHAICASTASEWGTLTNGLRDMLRLCS